MLTGIAGRAGTSGGQQPLVEYVSRQLAAMRERLLAIPVVKSGLSLMTGTIITAALGLVFWIVAAQLYDSAAFGVGTTTVYTMMTLAEVACIGLRTGLVRYTPKAGGATIQVIVWGYALAFAASAVTAAVFLVGLGVWAPELGELRDTALMFGFFVISTAFWAIFMLQDSVLVGLRKAPWVPVENGLFGVLKIILLFPLAAWSPTLGIFWAWTLPVFPIVFVINFLIRPVAGERIRLAPKVASVRSSFQTLLREMINFSLAEWVASISRLAAFGIVPLMVLAAAGRIEAGYFQASWLIAFTIFQLSSNAAYALLAESSYEGTSLQRNSVQAGLLSLALSAPGIAIGIVGAPVLLLIYGSEYADNSSGVLRILLIAALPNIVHQIYIGRLRSRGKMVAVILLETALSVLVITLSAILLPRMGIIGVGYAWLIGLVLLALYAAMAETTWWWASGLPDGLVRFVGSVLSRSQPERPVRGMEGRLGSVLDRIDLAEATASWLQPGEHRQTAIVQQSPQSVAVVEFARTPSGAEELRRRSEEFDALHRNPDLVDLRPLLPTLRSVGSEVGQEYVVWDQPLGQTAESLATAGHELDQICAAVLDRLKPLHRTSARRLTVCQSDVDRWIGTSLDHLGAAGRGASGQLDELRARIEAGLIGREVEVGQIHGELALDNIVMADQPLRVTGLVRWELTGMAPLILDPSCLAISDLVRRDGGELGSVVASLLADPLPYETHPAIDLAACEGYGLGDRSNGIGAETALLLTWLSLVGRPLPPGRTVSSDEVWLARNAQPVLATMNSRQGASS